MTHPDTVPATTQGIGGFKCIGLFPADHAAVESGKVYASGAYWSLLRFSTFPAVLPSCALVAVVRVPFHQTQSDHDLRFGMEDADGRPLPLEVRGQFRTAPSLEANFGEPGLTSFAVPVFGLTFERRGDYAFTFSVDSKPLSRYPFHVSQVMGLGTAVQLGPA